MSYRPEDQVFNPDDTGMPAIAAQYLASTTSGTEVGESAAGTTLKKRKADTAATAVATASDSTDGKKKKKKKTETMVKVFGIPSDATPTEIADWAKLAGVIKKDVETGEPLIKVQTTESGDSVVWIVYLFKDSLRQADLLLHESEFRLGEQKRVQVVASPELEKEVFGAAKSVSKKMAAQVTTVNEQRTSALSWDDGEVYRKRHVIIKGLFDPATIDPTDLSFYADLKEDLKEECEKLGEIETLHVFERSPEGVAAVKFCDWLGADRCIRLMDGRWFDQRRLTADYYDGKSNYAVKESAADQEAREKAFGDWLGGDDDDDDDDDDES